MIQKTQSFVRPNFSAKGSVDFVEDKPDTEALDNLLDAGLAEVSSNRPGREFRCNMCGLKGTHVHQIIAGPQMDKCIECGLGRHGWTEATSGEEVLIYFGGCEGQ